MSDIKFKGEVPFSWENKPGISKAAAVDQQQQVYYSCPKDLGHDELIKKLLPPPPYRTAEKIQVYAKDNNDDQLLLRVPLPPCAFHHPTSLKRSSRGLIKKIVVDGYDYGDPFLNAYKKCTKTTGIPKSLIKCVKNGGFFGFSTSCKSSCSVRDDNLVKVSQLSNYFSQ